MGVGLPTVTFPPLAYYFPTIFDYFIVVVGAWILADWGMRAGRSLARLLPDSLKESEVALYLGLILGILVISTVAAETIRALGFFNSPSYPQNLVAALLKSYVAGVLMFFYILFLEE